MIIVTGGAGFIGSNLIKALNQRGERDILLVDNLTNGRKMHNIADLDIADYWDKDAFIGHMDKIGLAASVRAVFHQGACSATTEWDGRYIMANNYEYSKRLLGACLARRIPFLYASSASVYGTGQQGFDAGRGCERPINMYAYSKFQFDQYVRRILPTAQSPLAGFRYFNVYGPREQHKDGMASTVFHFNRQLIEHGAARLFEGCDGYADGEQRRDFIHVEDVVAVNLWFFDHPEHSGIFNVGTGQAESFNAVAKAAIAWHGRGHIEYIPFPDHLKGAYQSFTEADIRGLRQAGYGKPFLSIEQGINRYFDGLNAHRQGQA